MKNVHPAGHPENEVSKCVNANSAEWRPAFASTDRQTSMTDQSEYQYCCLGLLETRTRTHEADSNPIRREDLPESKN